MVNKKIAKCSPKDYDWINAFKWAGIFIHGNEYAIMLKNKWGAGSSKVITMGEYVAQQKKIYGNYRHKDGNGLNCTRTNIEACEDFRSEDF